MDLSVPSQPSIVARSLAIFGTLAVIIAVIFLFREPLGVMKILSVQH